MKIYRNDAVYETTTSYNDNIIIGCHDADVNHCMNVDDLTENEIICISALIQTAMEKSIYDYLSIGRYKENRVCITKSNNVWETYIGYEEKALGSESFDNCFETCMAAIDKISGNKEDTQILTMCFSKHMKSDDYQEKLKLLTRKNDD